MNLCILSDLICMATCGQNAYLVTVYLENKARLGQLVPMLKKMKLV